MHHPAHPLRASHKADTLSSPPHAGFFAPHLDSALDTIISYEATPINPTGGLSGHFGRQIALTLIERHQAFEAEELLELFDEGLLLTHQYPISAGQALGCLTWGVLQHDQYWSGRSSEREAFIANLLFLGFESEAVAKAVSRAFRPALGGPEPERVGFSKAHEALLEADSEVQVMIGGSYLEEWLTSMLAMVRQDRST